MTSSWTVSMLRRLTANGHLFSKFAITIFICSVSQLQIVPWGSGMGEKLATTTRMGLEDPRLMPHSHQFQQRHCSSILVQLEHCKYILSRTWLLPSLLTVQRCACKYVCKTIEWGHGVKITSKSAVDACFKLWSQYVCSYTSWFSWKNIVLQDKFVCTET